MRYSHYLGLMAQQAHTRTVSPTDDTDTDAEPDPGGLGPLPYGDA